jgi:fumarylpyruvate hydrolase
VNVAAQHVLPGIAETALPVAGGGMFPVRRVYCVGRNYIDHIREMKEADERDPPFFFQKPRDAVVPDGAQVPYPPFTTDFQFEVELVVALGLPGRNIGVGRALEHVWGYAVGIDLTRRDLQQAAKQRGEPWDVGKAFDHSAPIGAIRPVAQGHLASGRMWLKVNNEIRQQADLANMIWSVPEIIAELSSLFDLQPGDLIYTGTPAGVGPLRPGDRIEAGIDGLEGLATTIAAGA